MSEKKTPRKSLSRQVMDSIQELIVSRDLQPGDALPTEKQIAEELGVSKSSVREAVKMLEALGIVEIRRGLCTVISENPEQGYLNVILSHFYLQSGRPEELREFRRTIETAYTTLAVQTATEEDVKGIRRALEQFRAHVEEGRVLPEDDVRFHNQILYATHNSFLIGLGVALNNLLQESIGVAIEANPAMALRDHEAIFQGFLLRRPDLVTDAITDSSARWSLFLP